MSMPHTAITIMALPLVGGTTSTLQIGPEAITILTFIATVIHTQVLIVTVACGPETTISALMI